MKGAMCRIGTASGAALVLVMITGCPDSEADRPPVTTTKPIEPARPTPTAIPAEQPAPPPEDPDHAEVRMATLTDPQFGWLRIEGIRDSAVGAWATGSFLSDRNKIVIETENADQFTINLAKLRLNWNKRVILRINGHSSELTKKRDPLLRLHRSPAGSWDVVE